MHEEGLEPAMTQLKYLFYFFVYLLGSIRILKLDYNYMYIHNNLHDQLNYNFHFLVYLLGSFKIMKLQLLDYNYMYIYNNLPDQLNYNFHYSLQLY